MAEKFVIRRTQTAPDLARWDDQCWNGANEINVATVRRESSDHHPDVRCKLLYSASGFYGIFKVADRYVRCTHQGFNVMVCKDSCVEFFFQPFGKGGYFNFEMNCGGALLCYFIEDHARKPGGFAKFAVLQDNELEQVTLRPSLPTIIDPEITEPTTWTMGFFIPFAILEKYCGKIDAARLPGTDWRANFFKCADATSQKHWISWQPITALNFHLPECFGEIAFE